MFNFPTWIPDCNSHSPALLDLSLSSDTIICSTMAFPPLGNSDHVAVSVSTDFTSNSKQDVSFHCALMTILMLTGMVFMIMQEMSHGKILLSLMVPAASEFCEWVYVGINVYIPHHQKYQVKPDSSPWFSAACAAAIVQRNHFFVCTNRINFLNPK